MADNGNQTIRKITAAGNVTTLAGAAAYFRYPNGLAVDAGGTLYVTDYMNAAVRKVTTTGEVTPLAGPGPSLLEVDGPGPEARFESPWGVAIGAGGTL